MSELDQTAQAEAINTLYGTEGSIKLDSSGLEVKVKRINVRSLGTVLGLVNNILKEIGVGADGKVTINLQDSAMLFNILSKVPDEATKMCEVLSSLSKEKIEELELDDALQLFTAVLEVNRAFFTQKIKPKLDGMLKAAGMKSVQTTS
jgi:hypothetical protein